MDRLKNSLNNHKYNKNEKQSNQNFYCRNNFIVTKTLKTKKQ